MPAPSRFGEYGGMYVSELLAPALLDLATAWEAGVRRQSTEANVSAHALRTARRTRWPLR